MANYRVISSDNHVFEPSDLWTSRARPAFKDRVPQLVREYDGDWWYCDDHRVIGLSAGAQTGMRFEAPEKMVRTTTFDRVRRPDRGLRLKPRRVVRREDRATVGSIPVHDDHAVATGLTLFRKDRLQEGNLILFFP